MWKRSPDRKAPVRKAVAPVVKAVSRKKVVQSVDNLPLSEEEIKMEQSINKNISFSTEAETSDNQIVKTNFNPKQEVTPINSEEEYQEDLRQEDYQHEEEVVPALQQEEVEVPKETVREAPRPRGRQPTQNDAAEQSDVLSARTRGGEDGPISKQAFQRLIKSSKVPSANTNVIDALKEMIVDFTDKVICEVITSSDKILTGDKMNRIVARYIKDEERELINEPHLAGVQFERLIRPVLTKNGVTVKRDAFFVLHLFIESMMIKLLQAGDMIAEANRRQRIDAKDVSVAYMIFTM